jgi:hypothetical protein
MTRLLTTYVLRPSGLLLVLMFAASLVWCGDGDCSSGAGNGGCASLICSLLASHSIPDNGDEGNCSTQCMCLCHTPTIPGIACEIDQQLIAQNTTFVFTASPTSTPARPIYHPPKS